MNNTYKLMETHRYCKITLLPSLKLSFHFFVTFCSRDGNALPHPIHEGPPPGQENEAPKHIPINTTLSETTSFEEQEEQDTKDNNSDKNETLSNIK
jgi:hypothetical protein